MVTVTVMEDECFASVSRYNPIGSCHMTKVIMHRMLYYMAWKSTLPLFGCFLWLLYQLERCAPSQSFPGSCDLDNSFSDHHCSLDYRNRKSIQNTVSLAEILQRLESRSRWPHLVSR